jgi:hypothetical protein
MMQSQNENKSNSSKTIAADKIHNQTTLQQTTNFYSAVWLFI